VSLTNSIIANNTASAFNSSSGAQARIGGMRAFIQGDAGSVSLTNSTVANNTASATGLSITFAEGGGLIATATTGIGNVGTGIVSLTNSTVSDNLATATTASSSDRASAYHGGVLAESTRRVSLTNSTVSNNTASAINGGGALPATVAYGGLYAHVGNENGTLELTSVTVVENRSQAAGGTSTSAGNTVFANIGVFTSNEPTLRNSIVADNDAVVNGLTTRRDLYGGWISLGHNLIGAYAGGLVGGPQATDLLGTPAAPLDPLLAPLADNGGPTCTHALLPGSPALNAGTAAGLTTDQRGFTRPVGQADIGAFEVQPTNQAPTAVALSPATVAENAVLGTVVGTLTTTDPDTGDSHTYELLTDADGRFALVGSQIVVAGPIDFEATPTLQITVRTTDGGGLSHTEVITITVANVLEVTGFDVQKGQTQRSFLRYLDLTFAESEADIQALITSGRVKLTRYNLDGSGSGDNVDLTGVLSATGNTLAFDFGALGLGGNPNSTAADGWYWVELDLDGDGTFETTRKFYRLLGDVDGDRQVTQTDAALVKAAYNTGDPERNVNGDAVVNALDLTLVLRSLNRKLGTGLWIDD